MRKTLSIEEFRKLLKASDRFHASYTKNGPNDCWIWTRRIFKKSGYGCFNFAGTATTASRVAMMLTHGPISGDLDVCHSCDNRACVNPSHLWIGTPLENGQDRATKGRNVSALGAHNGQSKLTPPDIEIIRSSGESPAQLAKQFGVSRGCISQIINRKIWNHV